MVSGSFWVVSDAFSWFQVVPRFSKYSMKVKKVSNLNLFDACVTLINLSRDKKLIDGFNCAHFFRNLKMLKKTEFSEFLF